MFQPSRRGLSIRWAIRSASLIFSFIPHPLPKLIPRVVVAQPIDEMFNITVDAVTANNFGPRRAQLLLTPEHTLLETPHYLAITSRGVVPHLSPDTFIRDTNLVGVYIGLEDFIERAPDQVPPLYQFLSRDDTSPLRRFIALSNRALCVLGPRRTPPVIAPAANPNTNVTVAVSTAVGFRPMRAEHYAEAAERLCPDIIVGLGDIPYGRALGSKRVEKAVDRTTEWMREHIALRASADECPRTTLFAPLVPVSCAQQSYYIEQLDQGHEISGLAIYNLDSLVDLPAKLSHLPRLAFTTPETPHEVLRQIALGVDLLTIPFITAATDAGIALDFSLRGQEPDATSVPNGRRGASPLGIDMWSSDHATDVSPLVAACTCYTCTDHHRAYIQHLLNAKEMTGWLLLQIHNHHVMDLFFAAIRESIGSGTFVQEKLSHLPRLAFTTPETPHEVLRQIALGVDLLTIPFITAATDAGIALDFSLRGQEPDATSVPNGRRGASPLGIDMWSSDHATDVSPLVAAYPQPPRHGPVLRGDPREHRQRDVRARRAAVRTAGQRIRAAVDTAGRAKAKSRAVDGRAGRNYRHQGDSGTGRSTNGWCTARDTRLRAASRVEVNEDAMPTAHRACVQHRSFHRFLPSHTGCTCLTPVLPEVGRRLQIIHVQQIHAGVPQRAPDGVARPDRPAGLIPVAHHDAAGMRRGHLLGEQRLLGGGEALVAHAAELHGEVGRGDRGDVGGDVAERRAQRGDRRVPEVVARRDALHLVQRRVARPDHRHGPRAEPHAAAVVAGQVAGVAQRLQRAHDVRPGGGATVLPEVGRRLQIIHVQQIHAGVPQRAPDGVARPDRPAGLIPVAHHDAAGMRRGHLLGEQRLLGGGEALVAHAAELHGEVGRGDRGDVGGDVAERRAQRGDRRVPEVVARRDALHLVQRRVARPDHRHGPRAESHAAAVVAGQVAGVAQRLQRAHDVRPGGGAVGLDVDEEVEGLGAGGVVDAVARGASHEARVGVLPAQDVEDGLDVERGEGARGGERALLVADVQRVVVQPDIGFDADGADGERGVEG
nr:queuine trna-ribosyltransferase accessory subunit 2 [Quercus suber]